MRINFLQIAQIELDDAIDYYNYEVPGLGDAFLTEVLNAPVRPESGDRPQAGLQRRSYQTPPPTAVLVEVAPIDQRAEVLLQCNATCAGQQVRQQAIDFAVGKFAALDAGRGAYTLDGGQAAQGGKAIRRKRTTRP